MISNKEALADAVREFILRFIVMAPEQVVACTLWVFHTWVFEFATATPYLVVVSPTPRSGKTRVLEVLESLVRNPMRADDLSPAVLFRSIEQFSPTMLLDEVDTWFATDSERTELLRGMLNSGNREGGSVLRCVPPNWDVKAFSTFCAKCLAGIDNGRWPDTLLDRSVVIRVMRRTKDEVIERFRYLKGEQDARPLREGLRFWAATWSDDVIAAKVSFPEELSDRACDAWEPLFAIAEVLGGEWPALARHAAITLFHRQESLEGSIGVTLLRDIKTVFASGAARMKSQALAKALRDLPDSRWASWGVRRGDPGLRPVDLAMLLRPFSIAPRPLRYGSDAGQARGYDREDFKDAWHRYVTDDDDDA